MKFTLHYI